MELEYKGKDDFFFVQEEILFCQVVFREKKSYSLRLELETLKDLFLNLYDQCNENTKIIQLHFLSKRFTQMFGHVGVHFVACFICQTKIF